MHHYILTVMRAIQQNDFHMVLAFFAVHTSENIVYTLIALSEA